MEKNSDLSKVILHMSIDKLTENPFMSIRLKRGKFNQFYFCNRLVLQLSTSTQRQRQIQVELRLSLKLCQVLLISKGLVKGRSIR